MTITAQRYRLEQDRWCAVVLWLIARFDGTVGFPGEGLEDFKFLTLTESEARMKHEPILAHIVKGMHSSEEDDDDGVLLHAAKDAHSSEEDGEALHHSSRDECSEKVDQFATI